MNGYDTDILSLFRVYNDLRGDKDTKPLVDAMIAAGQAAGAFDRETKRMQGILHTSQAQLMTDPLSIARSLNASISAENAKLLNEPVEIAPFEIDMSDVDAEMQAFLDAWKRDVDEVKALNNMLEESFVQATSGAVQSLMDMLMGIEGADASQVLAALLQPFANTMISLGEMLIAQGIAIEAFKTSLATLDGVQALAAGATLLAIGAALSSGIKALSGGTATTTSSAGNYGSSSSSSRNGVETYNQEITVYVVGEISGDKIVLVGQKTINKWNR